jgi:RNA polymerase sigma factor for flagellar operon FliA
MATSAQIKANAPLVRAIAGRMMAHMPASVEVDDLIQAGLIGLADAINRFEDGHGAAFETFAARRIRGAMLDELRGSDWMSRLYRKEQKAINDAQARLERRLCRPPRDSEVAAELGMGLREYQAELALACTSVTHLEDINQDGDDFLDFYRADDADPCAKLIEAETNQALAVAVNSLPDRELYAFVRRSRSAPMQDIAASLGVTPSRVSQLIDQAIHKVRRKMAAA